jgi:acyl carrier protein
VEPDEKLRRIVAEALDLPVESIHAGTAMQTTDAWTSLAHLRLVTEIESAYGVSFGMDEALALDSVAKLAGRLDSA